MKSIIRKIIVTICAISTAMTVASVSVYATEGFRSGPNDSSVTDTT